MPDTINTDTINTDTINTDTINRVATCSFRRCGPASARAQADSSSKYPIESGVFVSYAGSCRAVTGPVGDS